VKTLEPTARINLDLSALIAVVSDLTHSPLPQSAEEADARFIPSQRYLKWKKQRLSGAGKTKKERIDINHDGASDIPSQSTHARALVAQVTQEMGRSLLQDMHDRIFPSPPLVSSDCSGDCTSTNVEFWTTPEAHDRCLRILSKIGGPNERRRATALFSSSSTLDEVQEAYWRNSSYPPGFLPLPPIHIYPCSEPNMKLEYPLQLQNAINQPPFFKSLASTCKNILAQETGPHPKSLSTHLVGDDELPIDAATSEIQRAAVTKANPRLTAHTVQSLLWGAELGWTTLTANKSSVKVIFRDMKQAGDVGRLDPNIRVSTPDAAVEKAALWLVDPRSLAEGQRADFED